MFELSEFLNANILGITPESHLEGSQSTEGRNRNKNNKNNKNAKTKTEPCFCYYP